MNAEIIWHEVPPEIKTAVSPLVEKYLPFLPPWATKLHVEWDDSKVNAVISTAFNEPYGRVRLIVRPSWLESVDGREEDIAHEVAHLWFAITQDFMEDVIEELPKDLRHFTAKRFETSNERACDFLSRLIMKAANS